MVIEASPSGKRRRYGCTGHGCRKTNGNGLAAAGRVRYWLREGGGESTQIGHKQTAPVDLNPGFATGETIDRGIEVREAEKFRVSGNTERSEWAARIVTTASVLWTRMTPASSLGQFVCQKSPLVPNSKGSLPDQIGQVSRPTGQNIFSLGRREHPGLTNGIVGTDF
jgi:hypothetical protein